MINPQQHDPLDVLGGVYETMYERSVDNLHHAEEKTGPLIHELIDEARDKAIELKEVSEDEAEKVSNWLKRDVADAVNYLADTGHELKDWLGFETDLLEKKILDLLLKISDKTTVKLLQIKEEAHQASRYLTGEVTGPGTLVCSQCGEKLHFHKAGKIPPCPKCHATEFHR